MANQIRHCALCGSADITEILTNIYECADCGETFVAFAVNYGAAVEKSLGLRNYIAASEDKLVPDVLAYVIKSGSAAVSAIQRRFLIGYARAGRMIDYFADAGYIGPNTGCSKPREVLITRDKFRELFGRDVDDYT